MHLIPRETEVFIVGGGPAGLAAAIAACQAGLKVTVADSSIPPIDKACGEGIMPDGLAALEQLDVTVDDSMAAPFLGIRFVGEGLSVAAKFAHGVGRGVRRTTLHTVLAGKAANSGARLLWGARVSGLTERGVTVNGREISSRWVVGADGHNSRVRRWAGLKGHNTRPPRFGFRRHFAVSPWSQYVEVYWSDRGQVTVTPIGKDEICAAIVTRDPHFRFESALRVLPLLRDHLAGATPSTREHGAISATSRLHHIAQERVALIGEASGSVDALTGEGLSMAFQQALALARALKKGTLRQYEREHRRILGLPRAMGGLMLTMDRSGLFRRRVFQGLASDPALFARLLALHTGASSVRGLGIGTAMRMGWQLLAA